MYEELIQFLKDYEKADYVTIKTNIRRLRNDRGLTPKYFEAKAGIPANQYGQFEKLSYKYKPAFETCIKICNAMDVKLSELLVPLEQEKPAKKTLRKKVK